MRIHIVGINHGFQRLGRAMSVEFMGLQQQLLQHLQELLQEEDVTVFAEEYSSEALIKYGDHETLLQDVARKSGKRHLFCDPNTKERAELRAAKAGERKHAPREEFWLRRLEGAVSTDSFTIFLCGEEHLVSFSALCSKEGLNVSWELIK